MLSIRESTGGTIEIVNTGNKTANDIELELVEKERRVSGRLAAKNSLSKDQAATLSAYDGPQELHAEFNQHRSISFEATLRRLRGEDVTVPPDRLAHYLLTRKGKQVLVVSYGIPDSTKRIVRIFVPAKTGQQRNQFQLRNKYSAKLWVRIYCPMYRRRPVYISAFNFSRVNSSSPKPS